MMRELLLGIAGASGLSYGELAERLGVDKGMVEVMVGELERKGYLRREGQGGCPSRACTGCPPACGGTNPSSWVLTDKGRRSVAA